MSEHEFHGLTHKLVDTVCEQDDSLKLLQAKYAKALAFIREVSDGFCLNQTTDEALLHFVKIEADAHGLLEILGEDK
jgi:hypothetical protein